MEKSKRFRVALAIYAVLGLLIWTTISDIPVSIAYTQVGLRSVSLAILAIFVVRTLIHWTADRAEAQDDKEH